MASPAQVKITYENAIRESQRLGTVSVNLQQALNRLDGVQKAMTGQWEGAAKLAFDKNYDAAHKLLEVVIENATILSDAIRNTAKRYYDNEMEAIRIVNNRSYLIDPPSGGGGGGGR